MSTTTDENRARKLRRQQRHARQSVVFGVLIALMALAGLSAAAVGSGLVTSPLKIGFSSASVPSDKAVVEPCLVKGKEKPVAYSKIKINVYNASTRKGLAASTSKVLQERGFAVLEMSNTKDNVNNVQIRFGAKGVGRAYTLAAQFKSAILQYDARTDSTLDLTVGEAFEGLLDAKAVSLKSGKAMTNAAGCKPVTELTPIAAPAQSTANTTPSAGS